MATMYVSVQDMENGDSGDDDDVQDMENEDDDDDSVYICAGR